MAAKTAQIIACAMGKPIAPHADVNDTKRSLHRSIPSPRQTLLPYISSEEAETMAYPPAAMPGARDVSTDHGTMRVYEWGPEAGRRIVFVHGLTSPSPVYARLAHILVAKGCRVLLFDLWGVGYSDSPIGCRYSAQLFSEQISAAISSSTTAWEGRPFSMIGYSLGATIALHYANTFPHQVDSIILIAPGGLLRRLPPGYGSFCLRHWKLMPDWYLRRRVAKLLMLQSNRKSSSTRREVVEQSNGLTATSPLDAQEDGYTDAGVSDMVQWAYDHHAGFIEGFCNAVRYGPICGQQGIWRHTCRLISSETSEDNALGQSPLMLVFGSEDKYIDGSHVEAEVLTMLDEKYLRVEYVHGSHGIPYTNTENVAEKIATFWRL